MTVKELRDKLRKYSDDYLIVVTVKEDDRECTTYNVADDIGEGWLPSGVIELNLGDFATD